MCHSFSTDLLFVIQFFGTMRSSVAGVLGSGLVYNFSPWNSLQIFLKWKQKPALLFLVRADNHIPSVWRLDFIETFFPVINEQMHEHFISIYYFSTLTLVSSTGVGS